MKMQTAPVNKRVMRMIAAGIVLFALTVTGAYGVHAGRSRGTIQMEDVYPAVPENGTLLWADGAWSKDGRLEIAGALIRAGGNSGVFNVRVVLKAQNSLRGIVLNTQLERRQDLAEQYGCSMLCGYHAAIELKALEEEMRYDVLLADADKLYDTGSVLHVGKDRQIDMSPKEEAHEAE